MKETGSDATGLGEEWTAGLLRQAKLQVILQKEFQERIERFGSLPEAITAVRAA